jgi:tetratricopeptide (TPR) repeat protein
MGRARIAIVVLLLGAASARAQEAASPRVARLAEWLRAVRTHEPGTADGPLTILASWSRPDVGNVWLDAQTLLHLARCDSCSPAPVTGLDGRVSALRYSGAELRTIRAMAAEIRNARRDNDLLKRAAILHTDIILLAPLPDEPNVPQPLVPRGARRSGQALPSERVILKSTDGRQDSIVTGPVHWDMAYALLDIVTNDRGKFAPQEDETVRLWYRATIAYLQTTALHDPTHFARALRLFPADADVQFQNGCLHESLASPPVQTLLKTATIPPSLAVTITSEHAELASAERFFRKALDLEPTLHEARLRLGHVLGLLDRHEEALSELRQVPDDLDDVALRFYAALFVGREEEALGRRAEARAAYDRAASLFPLAQSPYVALSHLARESGDRAAALASIQHLLDLSGDEMDRRDPYWVYNFYEGRFVDVLFDRVYAPFRSRARP